MVAQHISNGMYGLILVEPEGGLPPVDREFYVMQGEIYTDEAFGTKGSLNESVDKLMAEQPEYYVFNGAAGALAGDNALQASVGETIRIYFGVGGPNKTSSFHVIGEIFDHAYQFASLISDPLLGVQTITVPPGGAAVVDLKVEVPGEYVLVDHALARAATGACGQARRRGPTASRTRRGHHSTYRADRHTRSLRELAPGRTAPQSLAKRLAGQTAGNPGCPRVSGGTLARLKNPLISMS